MNVGLILASSRAAVDVCIAQRVVGSPSCCEPWHGCEFTWQEQPSSRTETGAET